MATDTLNNLRQAVLDYDPEEAEKWARAAIEEDTAPLEVMDVLVDTIRKVGDDFGTGELFLPDLVGAADAMEAATPVVEEAIKNSGQKRESLGTVVIGTVAGDIHTIGKGMVACLLTAEGFEVHDVGIDVSTDKFVEAVQTYEPDLLAMSALLTTTAPAAKQVIQALEEANLRDKLKVMVGGGAITGDFASSIGADGYDPTAPGAAKTAREMLGL